MRAWTQQVDDLEEIGDLEGYIDRTSTILIYCSNGYFISKNCMRELVATTIKGKPTIALMDPESSHGGLSIKEVHTRLLEAEDSYSKWGFDAAQTPNGQALYDHLFRADAIEWNRKLNQVASRCRRTNSAFEILTLCRHRHLPRRHDASHRRAAAGQHRWHHICRW